LYQVLDTLYGRQHFLYQVLDTLYERQHFLYQVLDTSYKRHHFLFESNYSLNFSDYSPSKSVSRRTITISTLIIALVTLIVDNG